MAINITKYTRYVPWDELGIGASRKSASGGAVTIDLSQYYTISQLQTIGQSEILFDNIIEAYHNNMLGLQGGKVITDSSGTPSSEGDDEFYHLDEETYTRVVTWEFLDSLIEESDGTIHLVNDEDDPGILKYYGTDITGTKGWWELLIGEDSSGLAYVSAYGTPVDNQIAIWVDEDTIEGSTELSYNGRTFVFGGYPIDVPDVAHTMISIGAILNDYVNATYCVFIGLEAGVATTTGKENTAIGYAALMNNTTGSYNIAIGNDTGNRTKDNTFNETSKNSIYIGKSINPLASGDINEIIIGYEAQGAGSNTTVIGNYDTIGTYLAGEIYFITYSESSGGSDTTGSLPLADSSDVIYVVTYNPDTGKLGYTQLI